MSDFLQIAESPVNSHVSRGNPATFPSPLCLHLYASSDGIVLAASKLPQWIGGPFMKITRMLSALGIAAALCMPALAQGTWRHDGVYDRDGDRDNHRDRD